MGHECDHSRGRRRAIDQSGNRISHLPPPRLVLLLAALIITVGSTSCSQPDYQEIQQELQSAHPGCAVTLIGPGEGDADHVYVHFKYACPPDKTERRGKWLYRRRGSVWRKADSVSGNKRERVVYVARERRSRDTAIAQEQPFRVGGDVKPPILVKKVEPKYPQGLRRTGGVIVLEGIVTKEGGVRDLKIVKGANDPLTPHVLGAVKQWQFQPATLSGRPVDVIYNVTTSVHVR